MEELCKFVCVFALNDKVILLVDESEEVGVLLIIAGLILLHCKLILFLLLISYLNS